MEKILIIKLGAMGDVIRTTPLLHVLDGDIFWVTKRESIPLLPADRIKEIIDINDSDVLFDRSKFNLVLSLDDEHDAAELATKIEKDILIGAFIDSNGNLTYTDSAAEWFDMGLISKYGKEEADKLKFKNKKTWQEILFKMVGRKFKREEYILNCNKDVKPQPGLIGIEKRAGDRWSTKVWNKYDELARFLERDGYRVRYFNQRENIYDYITDIRECSVVVAGDTLAMHIALALKIPTVAIFTCTSHSEIYDYGRLIKVVSPLLQNAFYKREYIFESVDAISVDEVYCAIKKRL